MVKKAKVFKPGDFVFAKVKGYPAWPAKVTTINGKKYSIYFYGTGETGNLPPNDLFDYFENKKQFLAKVIKRRDYNDGLVQIEKEITSLGLGEAAPAGEAADVTAETDGDATAEENDPNNTTADEEKGEDADKTEDSTTDKAKESEENRTSEDMETNETEEPAGAVEATTESEATTDAAEPEPSVETPAPEVEKESPASTPGRAKRVAAAPKTPQPQKSPRRGMKQEPITPKVEPKTPLPETISRSGRKIKPKRYLDESQDSSPEGPKPGGKRAKLGSGPLDDPADQDLADGQATGAETAAETQAEKAPSKKGKKAAQNGEAVKKIGDRFNLVNASELEDIQEPFSKTQQKDGEADSQPKENILLCLLPGGRFVGIKLFQDRPESFGTPSARQIWENTTARNSLRLKRQLESGEIKPESISSQLETELQLTDDEVTTLKKERELDIQRNRLNFFRTENKVLELETRIKAALSFNSPDVQACIQMLGQMAELEVKQVMLLKHPCLVETVKRIRRYVGNHAQWKLTEKETVEFDQKAHLIRKKAEHCYNNFKTLFTLDEGKSFFEHFSDLVLRFKRCTKDLSELELLELDEEPAGFWKPGHLTMKAAAEELAKENNKAEESADTVGKEGHDKTDLPPTKTSDASSKTSRKEKEKAK